MLERKANSSGYTSFTEYITDNLVKAKYPGLHYVAKTLLGIDVDMEGFRKEIAKERERVREFSKLNKEYLEKISKLEEEVCNLQQKPPQPKKDTLDIQHLYGFYLIGVNHLELKGDSNRGDSSSTCERPSITLNELIAYTWGNKLSKPNTMMSYTDFEEEMKKELHSVYYKDEDTPPVILPTYIIRIHDKDGYTNGYVGSNTNICFDRLNAATFQSILLAENHLNKFKTTYPQFNPVLCTIDKDDKITPIEANDNVSQPGL
jgi:hypothetical protein